VNVELKIRRAGFGRCAKSKQGIFGMLAAGAAMGDYAGSGKIEKIAIQ
jgi:hypothetical protein